METDQICVVLNSFEFEHKYKPMQLKWLVGHQKHVALFNSLVPLNPQTSAFCVNTHSYDKE